MTELDRFAAAMLAAGFPRATEPLLRAQLAAAFMAGVVYAVHRPAADRERLHAEALAGLGILDGMIKQM